MDNKPQAPTFQRLNMKAFGVFTLVIIVLLSVLVGLYLTRPARLQEVAANQIRDLVASGRVETALKHLFSYVALYPDDLEMLRLQADLIGERATSIEELRMAILLHQRLLRIDDERSVEELDPIQLRLANLMIRYSDLYRSGIGLTGLPELATPGELYQAAERVARQVVERRDQDPDAWRTLGMALEGLMTFSNLDESEELAEAIESYQKALELDPGDLVAGERLSLLLRDRLDDPDHASEVIDRLVEARPDEVDPLLVQYRHLRGLYREAEAADVLDRAMEIDPKDRQLLISAAEFAIHRGDPVEAREYLDSINLEEEGGHNDSEEDDPSVGDPEAEEFRIRVQLLRGLISLAQKDLEQAIDFWRSGLSLAKGTDHELTWWMAFIQIRLGEIDDAAPLMDQYQRLAGGTEDKPFLLLQALIDEQQGRPQQAVDLLQEIESRLQGRLREEALMALGRCAETIGDVETARRAYQEASETGSNSTAPRLASSRIDLGEIDQLEAIDQAINEVGDAPELLLAKARILILEEAAKSPNNRTWARVDSILDQIGRVVAEGSVPLALLRADRWAIDGEIDEAIAVLERAIGESATDPRLWSAVATLLIRSDRTQEALERIDQGIEATVNSTKLRSDKAKALLALGRGREARQAMVANIVDFPSERQADLYQALGRLCRTQGDLEAAQAALELAHQKNPSAVPPMIGLLELAIQRDDDNQADEILKELREQGGPESLTYQIGQIATLLRRAERSGSPETSDDLAEAREVADALVKDVPTMAVAYLLRGRILERFGESEEALNDYQEALDRGLEAARILAIELLADLGRFDALEELATRETEPNQTDRDPRAELSVTESGDGSSVQRTLRDPSMTVGGLDSLIGIDRDSGKLDQDSGGIDPILGLISARTLLGRGATSQAARFLESSSVLSRSGRDPRIPRLLELVGRIDTAEVLLLESAQRAGPGQAGPWVELLSFMARHQRARSRIDALIDAALYSVAPTQPELLEARLRLVSGDLQTADQLVEESLEEDPDDPETLEFAASYYKESGRSARAGELLRRLIELHPENTGAVLELATTVSGPSDDPDAWNEAMELLKATSEGGQDQGESPEVRLAMAIVLSRSPQGDRISEAITLLENLLADLPASHPVAQSARDYFGRLLMAIGQFGRAAEIAAINAKGEFQTLESLALYAEALLALERWGDAEEPLDLILRRSPGNFREANLRVQLLLNRGGIDAIATEVERRLERLGASVFQRAAILGLLRIEGSPEALETAQQIAQKLAEARPSSTGYAAEVAVKRDDLDRAMEYCRSSISVRSVTTEEDYQTAKVLFEIAQRGRAAEALEILREGLESRSRSVGLLLGAAQVAHLTGDYPLEVECYRKIVQERPDNQLARYNLALSLSEGIDEPNKGLAEIDRLQAQVGSTPSILGARGVILTRLGEFEEAIANLLEAIALEPSPVRHFYLARAYHGDDRLDQCQGELEIVRREGVQVEMIDPWHQEDFNRLLQNK